MADSSLQQQVNEGLELLAAEKLKLEGMLTQPYSQSVIALIKKRLEDLKARESQLKAVILESELLAASSQAYAAAEEIRDRLSTEVPSADWIHNLVKELGEEIEGAKNE